jgi:hypothetical protein
MYGLLGRMLRLCKDMDALSLLLLHRLPLQNCSSGLQWHLPEVWKICENSEAWTSLYKPLHLNTRNDQHQNTRFGFGSPSYFLVIQNIITKDNVSINIDAAVYYRVTVPRFAYYRVQNFSAAISEVTYAILKNTCGQFILQDLLEKRQ